MSIIKRLLGRHKKEKKGAEVEEKTPREEQITITFVGEAFAGKTTILHRLRTGEFFANQHRTLGLNVDSFTYRDVRFQAFDLAGQESFRVIWENYLRLSDAVVFVIDTSNPASFYSSKEALYDALDYIKENAVLLIAANKADLSGVDPYVTLLDNFDLYEIQNKGRFRAVNIFHMSAKTGSNVYQAFDWLIETLTGEIILPNVNIHNVVVYQTDSGLMVGSSASLEGKTDYDPSLLTSMFSAVNMFAQASLGAGIREILMKKSEIAGSNEVSDNLKLVRVEESDFSVILIVDESDSIRKSVKIGKDLLNWIRVRIPSPSQVMELIDESEIKTYLTLKYPSDFGIVTTPSSY
ncbi:MAG: ADP-ribosylation factor-like protein [Candidatus Thorarchaeota archaeon]